MKQVKRFYFSIIFYILVYLFCFYTLKYFIDEAAKLSFILATLYFVTLFVRRSESNYIPSFLHSFSGLFLGIVWIGFATMLVINIFSLFLPVSKTGRLIGLIVIGILVLTAYINNKLISTKFFTLDSKHISKTTRIAQISDLHVSGPFAKHEFEKIMTKVMSENPDIIVISGDLIDVPQPPKPDVFNMLNQIKTPILFVTGNHDYYAGADYVEDFLTKRGVHVLRNRKEIVKGISFYGYDDPTGKTKLTTELAKVSLSKKAFNVLVYHQPRHVKFAADKGFDLMLSGHTHGGQLYPFNYLVRLQFKYVVGYHQIKNMVLYINPGTSTWEIPMRFGSRNTVAVFDIVPEK